MDYIDLICDIVTIVFKESIKSKYNENKLKEFATNYISRKKSLNGLYSLNEEYDYEGLNNYIKGNLIKDINAYIIAEGKDRATLKAQIVNNAVNYALAKHNPAIKMIQNYITYIIDICYEYYRNQINPGIRLITGEIEECIEVSKESIIQTIRNETKVQTASQECNVKDYINNQRDLVTNQLIFPWFRNSKKYCEVFPELFVYPFFEENNTNDIKLADVLDVLDNNTMITGIAGIGKSTLLRYLFAYKESLKTINKTFCSKESIYITAKQINGNIEIIKKLNDCYCINNKILVFIDGLDECFYNNYTQLESFFNQLKNFPNCIFCFACRDDYYYHNFSEDLIITRHVFSIKPWDNPQSDMFITKYATITNNPSLEKKVTDLTQLVKNLDTIKSNPFQLAILLYIAENDINNPITGIYDLYEKFMQVWIKKERLRGTSTDNPNRIVHSLRCAAKAIYEDEQWALDDVATNNTAVKNLLIYTNQGLISRPVASDFYHRNLATFLLAENVVDVFNTYQIEEAQELLSHKLKDDVTNFVLDKFSTMTNAELVQIKCNLEKIYNQTPITDSTLSIREQIIYFITRLGVDVSSFLIEIINNNPDNRIIRLTLAYGCVLSNNEEVRRFALKYAESIANGTEDALANRGWTVVYFGDVKGKDPYTYLDDEKADWKRAREARIKRFTKTNPRLKDVRFWLFDIPLFRSFLEDRDWNGISSNELQIIKSLSITKEFFNDREIEFLLKEKEKLIISYTDHLYANTEKQLV